MQKVSRNCRYVGVDGRSFRELPANRPIERSKDRRNSPNHHGVRFPWQGEIFVDISRAECVQPETSWIAVLAVFVYR